MRALAVFEWPALLPMVIDNAVYAGVRVFACSIVCLRPFADDGTTLDSRVGTSRQVEARAFDISHFGNKPRAG